MDLALPHRPLESAPRRVGIPEADGRAVRRHYLLLTGVHAVTEYPAVLVLSLHRSAVGEEQRAGRGVRAEGLRRFRHRSLAPDPHPDLALRSTQGPGRRDPGIQT